MGALDAKVRQELRRWLRRLHDEIGITSVFVTHDQEEALELADRVVVMREGGVEQIGTPEKVYEYPATPFVYQFLGNVNRFHGCVEGDKIHFGEFTMEVSHGSPGEALPAVAYSPPPSPRHRPSASRSTTVLRHRCVYPCGRVSRQSRVDHTDRGECARGTVTGEISIAASAKGCPGVRDCERAESLHRMMSMHGCGSPVITCPLAIWSSAWICLATARPGIGWPGFMSMMTLS
jgi:hypothetical protein